MRRASSGNCAEIGLGVVGIAVAVCCSVGGVQISGYAARALIAALSSLPFVLLTSCRSADDIGPVLPATPNPELDIALSTDLAVPQEIDSIRIERSVPGVSTRSISTEEHQLGPTDLELPAILRFQEYTQPASDRSVGVRVIAWKGTTPLVLAEAQFTFPDVGTVVVPLVLEAACAGRVKTLDDASLASSCPDSQTCRDGQCESIDRRAESVQ